MGSVGFPLKLSACILIFLIVENFCVTCHRPSNGGSSNDKRRSPININTNTVISDSPPSPITFWNYENLDIAKIIRNIGSHLQIDFQAKAKIFCDGFRGFYFLHQAHFHWGTENSNGAEHTIDGKRYAMEMHLVHTKNNMSIEDASKESDGLLVMSFLIKKTKGNNQASGWEILGKFLKDIPEKGNSKNLNGEFSLGSLWRGANVRHYFYYQGSLTSLPRAKSVMWIVFQYPLEISDQLHKVFTTSLYVTTIQDNRLMQNNFHPLQPLNGRSVYYSYYQPARKSLSVCLAYCSGKQF